MIVFLIESFLVFLASLFLTTFLVLALGGFLLGLLAVVGWIKQNSPWYGPILGALLYFGAWESYRVLHTWIIESAPWLLQRESISFSVMYWYGRIMGLGTFYFFARYILKSWAWDHWIVRAE